MPYYRSTLVAGTRGLVPAGFNRPGANWILFPNAAILWAPNAFTDANATLLATTAQEVPTATRRTTLAALAGDGRTYNASTTFRDAVVNLLRVRPADGRWESLKPSRTRRRFEIWLGPTVAQGVPMYEEPAVIGPSSKTFVDNFNRANADGNGSGSSDGNFTWLQVDEVALGWRIVSNRFQADPFDGFCTIRANADLDTDDHYAQCNVVTFTRSSGTLSVGPAVRWTGANGYVFEGIKAATNERRIYRYDNDATLATDAVAPTTGVYRLEVDGSSLTAKIDGVTVLGPVTNTQWAGQLRTGITSFNSTSANLVEVDDFEAGDIVPPRRFILGTH